MQKSKLEEPKERAKLKRKVSASESCIRTDLIKLDPNAGKAAVLEEMFVFYRDACVQLTDLAWKQFLAGDSGPLWRQVQAPNPLTGRSTILQPAERSAKGALESHLGWLARDCKTKIARAKRLMLHLVSQTSRMADENQKLKAIEKIDAFIHATYSINFSKAWMWKGKAREAGIMASGDDKPKMAAPSIAYDFCERLFLRISKYRHLPDASFFQVEATRGGASFEELVFKMEAPAGKSSDRVAEKAQSKLIELGVEMEPAEASQKFPYWVRFAVHSTKSDPLACSATSIVIPALGCRSFEARNSGALGPYAGKKGKQGFPIHSPSRKHQGKRTARRQKDIAKGSLNPGFVMPQAVESLALIRKVKGQTIEYFLGVRSEMKDPFEVARARYDPKVEALGLDWGLNNLMALSEPLSGSKLVGSGLLQKKVFPKLKEAIRIEGCRLAEKQALSKKKSQALVALNHKLSKDDADIQAWNGLESFPIKTRRSIKLRESAKGVIESFIGSTLNRIATEIAPKTLVFEELNFQDGGLSRELNLLLTQCGRSFFDRKQKDLYEKFGIEMVKVQPHWTSQECSKCGHIHPSNRQGEIFQCVSCGHQAHADENAALNIRSRRPVPGSKTLIKRRGSFVWEGGSLPMLSPERYAELKAAKVIHPRLFDFLIQRQAAPPITPAGAPQGSAKRRRAKSLPDQGGSKDMSATNMDFNTQR